MSYNIGRSRPYYGSEYGYGTGYSGRRYGSSYYRRGGFYSGNSSTLPSFNFGRYRPRYPSWRDDINGPDDSRSPADNFILDLHEADNTSTHHTDQYGVSGLVLRRGQEFKVSLRFDQAYTRDKYTIIIQFATGDEPKVTKHTVVRLNLDAGELTTKEWGATISNQYSDDDTECVEVLIMSACDAIVGKYTMRVDFCPREEPGDNDISSGRKLYKYEKEINLIFNPWCQDDQVYMSEGACREEYVMNETGRIYVGQSTSFFGRPWNFGQFAKCSLEAAMHLLENSYLRKSAHGNPTLVCRALSAMANSDDADNGILTGNWSDDFSGGTSPTQWNGSVAILERYMRFKRPIRYGQCWVFSGLITTLMRSLGIPTRSVTNFDSGNDTDFSMSIDTHVDSNGRPIRELDDFVWNFHVWNESWFERPDLPNGNGGWQAYDGTPLELSDNLKQCGPAPVNAIKEGNVFLGYDTKFMFAAVNGDRITWMVDSNGDHTATSMEPSSVGCVISTKTVGSNDREDLTSQYKYSEGSKEERAVVKRVSQYSSRKDVLKHVYHLNQQQDVKFNFTGRVEPTGDTQFELHIDNTSSESRSMHVSMYMMAKFYTGIPGQELSSNEVDITIDSDKEEKMHWFRRAQEYINKMVGDANICVYVMVKVTETGQIYTTQKTFSLEKPQLEVLLDRERVAVNEELRVTISFTNPLSVYLTSGSFMIEGLGIQKDMQILLKSFVRPGQTVSESVTLTPKYAGQREIIANFHSRQLTSIVGSATVQVV